MDSGRLIFDSSSSHRGHMLILGGSGNSIFRGSRSFLGMEDGVSKRRPFFTSPEELLEEEYYDEQLPEKKRRLTPEQVHMLERSFEAENKLEPERKSELAKKLGLQPRQVAIWFQNRRARWKTKQLERDFDRLKAAYDSLLADHDSLLKDNDRLRSQITTMNEKLQTKEPTVVEPVAESTSGKTTSPITNMQAAKAEDHLSTGSGGSAVVDTDAQQLVDSSGESYFHETFHGDCIMGPAVDGGGVHSEEDDRSDDGCNYLPFGENHHHVADNWWGVWN